MTTRSLPVATARQTWLWLAHELRNHRIATPTVVGVGVVAAAAAVAPAYLFATLLDRVQDGVPAAALTPIAILMVAAAIIGGVTSGVASYVTVRLGSAVLADLREFVMVRVLALPSTTVERAGKGDLLARIGDDVETIERAVSDVVPTVLSAALLTVLGIVATFGLDWRLALAGLVAAPIHWFGTRWYLRHSAPRYAEERVAVSARSQALVEGLLGAPTVHAYDMEPARTELVAAASNRSRDITIGIVTLFTRFVGRTNLAEFVGLGTVLAVGWYTVGTGTVTVGAAAAAAIIFHRLFTPVGTVLHSFDEIQAAGASLARLVGIVRLPIDPEPAPLQLAHTGVDIRGVTFAYDGGSAVLHDIDLHIRPAERVALVGASGAGKSTLAALVAGTLTPTTGSVTIGSVSVRDIPSRHVALVTQEVHLFAGPLIDDLRLAAPGAGYDEVRAALRRVGALDWVRTLPDELDTLVGELGHAVPAGRAQQLALARLVLAEPAVAVLDEAGAEAGSLGAHWLDESAAAATAGRTSLIVAHRLSQAATADRIVVLADGRVAESGTHTELVAAEGHYAQLWRAWAR